MADFNASIIEEFRANNGTVAHFGRGLVLLHSVGAKSGVERVNPVMGLHPEPDVWLIVASKGGHPSNPDWYHNLLATPEASIETPDDGLVDVRAAELPRVERDAAWAQITAIAPGFLDYEKRTDRVIPIVELRRR